ncbi:ankyrin repeat-containing protein [Heterostelium album PN500]|uniref:Ankyrin repeat-containing protein n=1 Tax=Heterostelium pallidum (strain ATCC 26659 / Pp 5 / PN500) TaxID=670386 RepID=D3BN49_HETP5|nr:ankyrin repeat-containing protein [Heterostelium album PN500]EFA77411.1 ankyrin repeat-containing protein [Heterostelium album PN500]|eukprot:XP_020429540.1 ankyrin repeat-containing protein [Heterostelium album PN500]
MSLTLFGGRLYEVLMVDSKWNKKPSLIQPKAGGIEKNNIITKCGTVLLEVTVIYSLYLYQNHRDVLIPLTISAVSHCIERLFELLYLTPKLTEIEKLPEAAVTESIANKYIKRSKLRIPLSIITNLYLMESFRLLTLKFYSSHSFKQHCLLRDTISILYEKHVAEIKTNDAANMFSIYLSKTSEDEKFILSKNGRNRVTVYINNKNNNDMKEIETLSKVYNTLKIKDNLHSTLKSLNSIENAEISKRFTATLTEGMLPSNLKKLYIKENTVIGVNSLPESLRSLRLGVYYGHGLTIGMLPKYLTTLRLMSPMVLVPGLLPQSLQKFEYDTTFNITINRSILPNNLKVLIAGLSMKFEAGAIPSSVRKFVSSAHFDIEAFENPNTLEILQFSPLFNDPIGPGSLPMNIKELIFGRFFNQPIERDVIPSNTETVIFHCFQAKTVLHPNIFPNSVKTIEFYQGFNERLTNGVLPSTLQTLDLGQCFNQPILPLSLPNSLKQLVFGTSFNQPLVPHSLPSNLELLNLGGYNHRIIKGTIPSSLTQLIFGYDFTDYKEMVHSVRSIAKSLPENLNRWKIESYNHDVVIQRISNNHLLLQTESLTFGGFLKIEDDQLD